MLSFFLFVEFSHLPSYLLSLIEPHKKSKQRLKISFDQCYFIACRRLLCQSDFFCHLIGV
ncbi:hypothetical protein VIBNIAM115_1210057 [Vibrio nigripulchritudo AM115]|nr:hypothetical protein VIBNIAM115_1210057 [Vibrio nigripulchritudo AM115]